MKIAISRPKLHSVATKSVLVVISLVVALAAPIQMTQSVAADQYDDRINALQQDIAHYQAEGARLDAEAATLQSALTQLASQKATIQAQIDISQAEYDQLTIKIADTEQKIINNQDALGKTIADMYVDGNVTPIEMLASSSSISDYMDKQEYQSSIRNQLTATISEIKTLKAQLVQQKTDLEKVLADQQAQKDALIAKENEQQNLLNSTQGDEAIYQELISTSQAKIAEARATQAAINSRLNSTGGYTLIDAGSLTDYPWNYTNCPMQGFLSTGGSDGDGHDGGSDSLGSDGYGCRQCASYVAWRFAKETSVYPYWGDAWQFTAGATSLGYQEGAAQAGSIAVMDPATAGNVYYGHVAWVESDPYVSTSGHLIGQTVIQVSQYNYNYGAGYGMYSLMELSVNAFDHYIHIK